MNIRRYAPSRWFSRRQAGQTGSCRPDASGDAASRSGSRRTGRRQEPRPRRRAEIDRALASSMTDPFELARDGKPRWRQASGAGTSGLQVRLTASESTSTLFYPGRRSTLSHTFAARFPMPGFAGVSSFRSCWREAKASYADFKDYFARLFDMRLPAPGSSSVLTSARWIASSSSRKLAIMLQEISALQRTKSRRVLLSLRPRLHESIRGSKASL